MIGILEVLKHREDVDGWRLLVLNMDYIEMVLRVLPDTDIFKRFIFELDPVDNSVKLLELKQWKTIYLSMSQKKELMKL